MRTLRPTLALALAAAAAVPLAALGGPAVAETAAPEGGASGSSSWPAPPATDLSAAIERYREATGVKAVAEATAPPAVALYVSDGAASVKISVDANGAPTGSSTSSGRTDVVVGPAGDTLASTPLPGRDATVVVGTKSGNGGYGKSYPASDAPVAWSPAGDGFVQLRGGTWVAQGTNPAFSAELDVPADAVGPAVSPYGGEVFFSVPAGESGSDLRAVPAPFYGVGGTTTPVDLGLEAWRPGPPAVSQAPDTGVYDPEAATYLAFLGTGPAAEAGTRQLFLDRQDSPGGTGYGAPTQKADAGFDCDVAAPAFTPDATRIAYVRSLDAGCTSFEVRLARTDSGTNTLLRTVTGAAPTVLSWDADNETVPSLRIDGINRYDVSAFTAFVGYEDVDAVVLAGGKAFADALAGGPLANSVGGPVLLTDPERLRPETDFALDAVLNPGSSSTVYILGGTASVSRTVENAVKAKGFTVRRIGGPNRFAVAVNVAKRMDTFRGDAPSAAFVSSGKAFADALVAGSPAAQYDAPILLSNGSALPDETASYLTNTLPGDADIFAIGGAGAASVSGDPRTTVVSGATRYDVAGNVAQTFFATTGYVGVADGRNWPDAASGGAFMASIGEPVLLANGTGALPAATKEFLLQSRAAADGVFVFGGTASVPSGAESATVAAAGRTTTYYGPFAP